MLLVLLKLISVILAGVMSLLAISKLRRNSYFLFAVAGCYVFAAAISWVAMLASHNVLDTIVSNIFLLVACVWFGLAVALRYIRKLENQVIHHEIAMRKLILDIIQAVGGITSDREEGNSSIAGSLGHHRS